MSHADAPVGRRVAPVTIMRSLPVALAAGVVALQIAYPLVTSDAALDRLTVAIVVAFAAASLTHAAVWRGTPFATALFAITALGGLIIEVVGVSTGVPFGEYRYLDSLGPRFLGVPLVIALAWTMMAYPAYVVAEIVGGSLLRRGMVGGWALASWDLFLDPQMVQAGHWAWRTEGRLVFGGIPVSNYVAWLAVATAMMLALRLLTRGQQPTADDRVPLALYLWTWASSVMAHALFFGLPTSAITGGIAMGVVVTALLRTLRADEHEPVA